MLTKTKKNPKKSKKKFEKTSGHMAQGKPQMKFESNPCDGRTDGQRTNFDFMSSADIVKQS